MNNLYGDIIEIDEHRCPVYPDVVVAYRSGKKIGVLRNVDALVNSNHMMEAPELSFDVHKEINGVTCDLWADVKDFRLIYVPVLDAPDFNPWYELHTTIDQYDETVKHCECFHIQETELSQLSLHNIEINTESDIDRPDYVPTRIYNESNPEASLLDRLLKDKASHYSIHHVDGSIANLQRTFSWNDTDIKSAFDDIAEEVECIFIYGLSTLDDGKIHRTISVYDLNDVCLDCGERGSFTDGVCTKCGSKNIKNGYGLDSGIFINTENFASEITYTSNADDVKNCFRIEAGDEAMTDAIRSINPTRSQYIWYLGDEIRADMSPELQSALNLYDSRYKAYEETEELQVPRADVNYYNTLAKKYRNFDSTLEEVSYPIKGYSNLTDFYYKNMALRSLLQTTLAPSTPTVAKTTAAIEAAKLTSSTLSPMGIQNAEIASASTVNSAVINYSKVFFESALYGIKIKTSSYDSSSHVWTGVLTLTGYTDSEDTADTGTITINVSGATIEYLKTLLEKQMKKNGKDATGTVALFELSESDFEKALANYSVDNLSMFSQIARSCLDVLIDQGCATRTSSVWADTYTTMYLPYYNKSKLLETELSEREGEVALVDKTLTDIENERTRIANVLDLRSFLGNDLWAEFSSFRRDGEYSNDNYISDGLTDKEIITNSQEFLKRAQRDLVKASTLQHTISCNINDLLLYNAEDTSVREEIDTILIDSTGDSIIDDDSDEMMVYVPSTEKLFINNHLYIINKKSAFAPMLSYFKIGNWIRVEIDDKVYKLRMTDYTVTYDDLSTIDVEFSDVTYAFGAMSDISSILSKSASMSTSYSTVSRQAGNGQKANAEIVNMVENGLYLTNKKIANAENQNLTIDESGLLVRQQGEYTNGYLPEQVKIINKGLYFTDDDWRTAKAAIGAFEYYDPADGTYKQGYGVIAEKIVGNLILGNNLGIYNESGSFTVNENGVTTYDTYGRVITKINGSNFYVQAYKSDGTISKLDLLAAALRLYTGSEYHGGIHNMVAKNLEGVAIVGYHTIGLSLGDDTTASNYYRLADSTAISSDSNIFSAHNFYARVSLIRSSITGILSQASLKVANNNVSSNVGIVFGVNDVNDYRLGELTMAARTDGNTQVTLYACNRNTSGTETGNGGIAIVCDKAGTISYAVSNAAGFRSAIGVYSTTECTNNFVNVSGDTMTGNLGISRSNASVIAKATNINAKTANNGVSSTQWWGFTCSDNNDYNLGRFLAFAQSDGKIGVGMWVYNRNTSGTQIGSAALQMFYDKSGNVSWSVSGPSSFRSAIAALGTAWTSLGSVKGTTALTINLTNYSEVYVCGCYSTSYRSGVLIPKGFLSATEVEWYLGGGSSNATSNRRGVFKMTTTKFTPVLITVDGTNHNDNSCVWYVWAR